MLVLGRKRDECITVDGPAKIVVQRISGKSVRLAIEADSSVKVLRGELVRSSQEGEDDNDAELCI